MDSNHVTDDNLSPRIKELKEVLFRLNDAMHDRILSLQKVQDSIVHRVLTGQQSMNPKVVENYKLADRTLARSLKLNIRIHQRNILYFKIRRRQLERDFAAAGAKMKDFDALWFDKLNANNT